MLVSHLCRAFPTDSLGLGGFSSDRRGVTSLEYALIAVIMVIAMLGGLSIIGGHLGTTFNQVASEL
ncbi:MAG TPA: Flp family type IVb pilin [Acidocella sp.]|nr:Flp family type IVb pilin [Acidocella sp.]